jgi:hypothetical protein
VRGDEVGKTLEGIFEQDHYRNNKKDRGSEFFNPFVKKVLQKYNMTL